ncbi:uncharacterized protein BO66DRAFT_403798 [Aspergillus aculeatinus CBS 121060]|uniref:Uncharacterized protein n=1 Tax=Aspergillus aculeatinus CBS 121060 TaxID=1448322 RepID=A0ACD1H2G2_9EURO|nr:hypothetical protein BO66DRAFT_403798 [Aspergillus aculeatinus CBS 121060]RAH67610.1 hypothetical protein BO66DRAFT_403798 [Aspergillus aculeatinus CBS 121060]
MILIVTLRNNFTAGDVGLSVNVILTVTRALLIAIQSWANFDALLGVISRIMDSVKTVIPEPEPTSPTVPPKSWPATGAVEPTGAPSGAAHALDHILLKVDTGQTISIRGRTGSGKFSPFC